MANRIIVLVPGETASGGIKHYYKVLKGKFRLPVEYIYRGARNWPYHESRYTEIKRMISDYWAFYQKLKTGRYALVQTSTSFGWAALIRDGIYILIARRFGVKTIVFYRGWNDEVRKRLEKRGIALFKKVFFKTDATIALSQEIKTRLIDWGYKNPIHIETTLFDESLMKGVDIDRHLKEKENRPKNRFNVLFLARVEKEKGIFEALRAMEIVQRNNPNIHMTFTIAGSGRAEKELAAQLAKQSLSGMEMLGHVDGETKRDAYLNADCYLFPSYREGMPNSVLEAMAFGLPIVSTPVGSIPEIVTEQAGFLADTLDSETFAAHIQTLIDNADTRARMSAYNSNYAKQHFYSDRVLERLEKIYNETTHTRTQIG